MSEEKIVADVSVIIPCYNQAHWLGDAIESCLNQTILPKEIIVVNDGSTDNTSEVAKKYNVKLVEKVNGGLSSARNSGIMASTGKYILTLDADDKIHPEFISRTIFVDDIVGTWQQEFGDSEKISEFLDHPRFEDFLVGNQINCCSLYKREIWDKVGGYDESMRSGYEDWQFWLLATKAGYTVTVIPRPLFYYRKHGKSMIDGAISKHNEIYKYIIKSIK